LVLCRARDPPALWAFNSCWPSNGAHGEVHSTHIGTVMT
jgi:hypothetical protein